MRGTAARGAWVRCVPVFAVVLLAAIAGASSAAAEEKRAERTACDEPAGDPDPETDPLGWMERDLRNILCSRQHSEDQLTNPEFLLRHALNAGPTYLENLRDQALEPERLHVNPVFWSPGTRVSDPFRIAEDWEKPLSQGGRLGLRAADCARLRRLCGRELDRPGYMGSGDAGERPLPDRRRLCRRPAVFLPPLALPADRRPGHRSRGRKHARPGLPGRRGVNG